MFNVRYKGSKHSVVLFIKWKKMKQLSIFMISLLCLGIISCSDDNDIAGPEKLEVTYTNIHGIWRLDEWNNEKMDGRYCYIDFNRSDQTFVMYDNIGSMYARKQTGIFAIEGNMDDGYLLTGEYDYTHESWRTYVVNELTDTNLTISVESNPADVSVYTRCEKIPEEIVSND